MDTKDVIYTEEFLQMDSQNEITETLYSAYVAATQSEDREYNVFKSIANSAKNKIGQFKDSVKGVFEAGENDAKKENSTREAKERAKNKVQSKTVDYNRTIGEPSNYNSRKNAFIKNNDKLQARKKATMDAIKDAATKKKIGGAAIGAVTGGAAGAGLAHLAMSKSRKEINELESQSNLTENQKLRLAALKKKVNRVKIASGVIGGVAGGIGGHHLGTKAAREDRYKLLKSQRREESSVGRGFDNLKDNKSESNDFKVALAERRIKDSKKKSNDLKVALAKKRREESKKKSK